MSDPNADRRKHGRRKLDLVMEKKIDTLTMGFETHLLDCTRRGEENTRILQDITTHLGNQDADLSEIRTIKRWIKLGFGSVGTIAALLEIIRFFGSR